MKPILVFQTDFTYKECAVSAMYGVVKSVDRSLEIYTSTHEIPKFDIWSASFRLLQPINFWPKGTVFISVVDPGVGTDRKASAARTKNGYYIFTPDNGTLTHIKKYLGISEIREIDKTRNRLRGSENVPIFEGRDVFAYCAAKFASGSLPFEEIGPAYSTDKIVTIPITESRIEDRRASGIIEITDPNFGNAWTNIPTEAVFRHGFRYGKKYRVEITHLGKILFSGLLPFLKAYGNAPAGEALIYHNELNRIAFALNRGNFSERYQIGYGNSYQVVVSEEDRTGETGQPESL